MTNQEDIVALIAEKREEFYRYCATNPTYLVIGTDLYERLMRESVLIPVMQIQRRVTTIRVNVEQYMGMRIIVVPTLGYCEVTSGDWMRSSTLVIVRETLLESK